MVASLPRRPGPTRRIRVDVSGPEADPRTVEDRVAVEEPLELRLAVPGLAPRSVGVMMRTPGHDFELACGWLCGAGTITPDAIESVAYCTDTTLRRDQEFNVVTVHARTLAGPLPQARLVDSACGVCGADVVAQVIGPDPAGLLVPRDVLTALPARLRAEQEHFERTGGTHGAGLFDADGALVVVREDVGRHNALDKAIGHCLLRGRVIPPIVMLSGRVSYELMQKAVSAGVSVIVAVGAPSSMAVDIARQTDRTLVGFTRPDRFVIYSGAERIGD